MSHRTKIACPLCQAKGHDSSGTNLNVFEDGNGGFCHRCNKYVSLEGNMDKKQFQRAPKNDSLELHAISGLPVKALTHKPIPVEVCERYGVRVAVSEEDGTVERVYYPYADQDGNTTGYKVRVLPKTFMVVGKLKGLFGQAQCKKGAKLLVITEGEDDALSAFEMLRQKGKNYNVVSIPNGANLEGEVDAAVRAEIEFITQHSIVVICMDNDKPGQATAKALAELLCSQTRVKILKLPRKDAGQMLIDGMAEQFEKEFYTKDYSPDAILKGSEISLETIKTAKPKGYELPYPELNRKLHGLRKGEITMFCAGSGIGKSTVAREISYHMATKHNLRIATIALETPVEDAARAFLAIDLNVPLHRLMFSPTTCVKPELLEASYDKIMKPDKLFFFSHWGSIASEVLIRKMHYFVKALKVDFIVLDHVSMVIAGEDITDERKSLDVLMAKLTNLVVETGVGVIGVVHLKRVPGKNYNKGDEVELVDLRGSAGLEGMSFSVIGVERDQQHDTKKDYSRMRVLKNRTLGFTGLADTLQYHHDTGRLLPANVEY